MAERPWQVWSRPYGRATRIVRTYATKEKAEACRDEFQRRRDQYAERYPERGGKYWVVRRRG